MNEPATPTSDSNAGSPESCARADRPVPPVVQKITPKICPKVPSQIHSRSTGRTSWHRATDVVLCVAQVVAKSVTYPEGDPATFARVEHELGLGLARGLQQAPLGDVLQRLRAVLRCPRSELLAAPHAQEWRARLTAVALVLQDYGSLSEATFDEIAVGLVSWRDEDQKLIVDTLDELLA